MNTVTSSWFDVCHLHLCQNHDLYQPQKTVIKFIIIVFPVTFFFKINVLTDQTTGFMQRTFITPLDYQSSTKLYHAHGCHLPDFHTEFIHQF